MEEHGGIQIGFLNNDPAIFSMDKETGKLTGMLAEYISYAKDCLGNQTLEFNIQAYDNYDEMIRRKKWLCTYKHSLDLQPDGGN